MATSQTTTAHVPPPNDVIHPRAYAHVVLRTPDVERLMAWYCTVFGAQVVLRNAMINFISWDHSQDRMAFMPLPAGEHHARGSIGVDHVAYEMHSLGDLVATYRRLQQAGITPFRCMNHGVSTSMYYSDPDGNQIELTVENFASLESLNAWLASGDFDINPGGVMLDPDALAERVESGVSEDEILRPEPNHRTWLAEYLAKRRSEHA